MLEVPQDGNDVKKILLYQMALIKQESEKHPDKIVELSHALAEIAKASPDFIIFR